MLQYLEPEKRLRAVPAHLRTALMGEAGPDNEFDARLIAAIGRAFHPGRIVGFSSAPEFTSRVILYGITFEGPLIMAEVAERY